MHSHINSIKLRTHRSIRHRRRVDRCTTILYLPIKLFSKRMCVARSWWSCLYIYGYIHFFKMSGDSGLSASIYRYIVWSLHANKQHTFGRIGLPTLRIAVNFCVDNHRNFQIERFGPLTCQCMRITCTLVATRFASLVPSLTLNSYSTVRNISRHGPIQIG
jgi:hypothetical protein